MMRADALVAHNISSHRDDTDRMRLHNAIRDFFV